jgi:hypothetical protein
MLPSGEKKNTLTTKYRFRQKYSSKNFYYDRSQKIYVPYVEEEHVFRNSIVYNYDSQTDDGDLTPTGNRAELRVVLYTSEPQNKTNYLYSTIQNMNAKMLYPFIGLESHGKTKLTIGKEINEPVSISEMKKEDRLNHCIKYIRFSVSNKTNQEWNDEIIEQKIKFRYKDYLFLGDKGYVFRKQTQVRE